MLREWMTEIDLLGTVGNLLFCPQANDACLGGQQIPRCARDDNLPTRGGCGVRGGGAGGGVRVRGPAADTCQRGTRRRARGGGVRGGGYHSCHSRLCRRDTLIS